MISGGVGTPVIGDADGRVTKGYLYDLPPPPLVGGRESVVNVMSPDTKVTPSGPSDLTRKWYTVPGCRFDKTAMDCRKYHL